MVTIIGRSSSNSRILLQNIVNSIIGEYSGVPISISWGIESHLASLNGMRRLDAIEQLSVLSASGVNVPQFTEDINVAREWVNRGNLVFGRKRMHSQGTDIIGPNHPRWKDRDYWVKVVPNILQEWRIHIFDGKSIARGLKVQVREPSRKMPIRNRKNGWNMVHNVAPPEEVRKIAKLAVKAVGYDFGGVDVYIATTDEGQEEIGVFEVNKAPGLDNYSAMAYANAIVRWIRNNYD